VPLALLIIPDPAIAIVFTSSFFPDVPSAYKLAPAACSSLL